MSATRQRGILKHGVRPPHSLHNSPIELSPKRRNHEVDMPPPDFLPSSDDDFSDMTADESDGPVFSEHPKSPSPRRSSMESAPPTASNSSPREPARSTSWSDLDLSVVIALVAPVGNWLTGNDHVKNLFLLLLLIVYLHQLIQVPWELYHGARTRRPHPSYRTLSPSAKEDPHLQREMKLAETELHRHELAYLLLAVVSPFIGAALLRYVIQALSGVDAISWFSTTLFVLATGIRPWAHLINRLRERTALLHDAVHYPSPESQLIADARLQAVLDRVQNLEDELAQVKSAMAERARVEEAYEDLNGALDDVERVLHKQERRAESTRVAMDTRLGAVEKGVSRALEKRRKEKAHLVVPNAAYPPPSAFTKLLLIIWSLLTLNFRFEPLQPGTGYRSSRTAAKAPLHYMKSPNRLETILEDATEARKSDSEDSSSELADNEAVLQKTPSPEEEPEPLAPLRRRHRRRSHSDPDSVSRSLVDVTSNVVTLPYRAAVRILVAISPPVQRLFT